MPEFLLALAGPLVQTPHKGYEPVRNLASLTSVRISRSNAKQRKGRAGRCRPGKIFYLYTNEGYERMPEYQLPEMVRIPVEELCMNVKSLHMEGSVASVLAKALTPPDARAVTNAIRLLQGT